MQTLGPSSQPLNITQADVMQILIDLIDVEGLEAARQAFKNMNDYFSVLAGWSDTKKAVHALFAETRRKEQREKFAEQLEAQRAGAPSFLLLNQNQNETTGIGKVDQLNGLIEDGAEVTHTKH